MRYSVSRSLGSLSFSIPSRFDQFLAWFFPFWLALFAVIVQSHPPNDSESYFTAVMFAFATVLMCHRWLWNLCGKEELDFNANTFTHRRILFGFSRTRVFEMNEISTLHFVGSRSRAMRGRTPSGLGFLYRGDQVKVGDDLTQAEARGIASDIIQEFPQYARVWGRYDERLPDSDKPVELNLRQN
jgi:hypothetical protein